MLPIIKGACDIFIRYCNIPIPITESWSIPVWHFFAAVLGIVLAFKFIRGLT